jgi:PAS domain S-box-containing protein
MNIRQTIDQRGFTSFLRERLALRSRIRRWLSPPVFEGDEEKTRVARLLNTVLLSLEVATVALLTTITAIQGIPTTASDTFIPAACVVVIVLLAGLRELARRGHLYAASAIILSVLWVVNTVWIYGFAGTAGDDTTLIYAAILVLTGLLLGKYGAIIATILTLASIFGAYWAENAGLISVPGQPPLNLFDLLFIVLPIGLAGILLSYAVDSLAKALDLARRSKDALAERTRELEASQRVTYAASERVSPDELLDLVVNLIRDQFDLYHAQVYTVDKEQGAAVLKQSTGYAGRQLLTRNHMIPLGATALVTKAIHTGESVLVDDTSKDPSFMANPLLPETRSELVVPLKLKEQIIGVLDVQDRTPGRFGPSTVSLFQSMADQVTILLENSELLERITEQTESLTIFTHQLRTAAEIARQMGTILDPERLLEQTVELLQSRFGLYHAHVYLLDGANRRLVMRAGSGEIGRVLRKQGHAIPLDKEKSLVARAARDEHVVVVNDTSQESDFMPNPLLPQTRSEVSIPLILGDQVLGVLDIQDDQPDRFSEADVDTYSTLAGQIATALQTASAFEQTRTRLQVSQALASAQTEEDVLDALIREAGFYPKTQVMIFADDWSEGEQVSVLRRSELFESKLRPVIRPGVRLPASQFRLVTEHAGPDGTFVSPNLPEDEHADTMAREMAKEMGTMSMTIVPIRAGDVRIGSIWISSEEEAYFDEQKLYLYRTLAEQGTTAFQIARLNDEVLERETRFTGFAEASAYGFGMGELTGQLAFANPTLLHMLDEEGLENVCQKTFFDYCIEEDRERLRKEILPTVMQQGRWTGEISLLSSKGKLTPTEQNIFLIRDERGEPRMVGNIITDITERKQAEAEREHFTTQLRTAAELAEQINAILDPDELLPNVVNLLHDRFNLYHAHIYLLEQPTREELMEASADEIARIMRERRLVLRAGSGEVGQRLLKRGHAIPLNTDRSLVARAARGRIPVLVNDTAREPGFLPNPLLPETRSEVAVALIAGDDVLGVLDVQDNRPDSFSQSDVDVLTTLAGQIATALQNASYFEEVQRTTERLRQVDRLKSEFLASMSHELRTPLNSIIGYTEIMLMGLDSELDPETLEDVQAIYNNGQHLLRIINDVLDLAKIEAGRLELNKEELAVEALVDAASANVTGLLVNKEKRIAFNVEIEHDLPTIWGDQVRLNQILNNLASNAVKFTDEGHITLRAFRDDGWICLEVEDTGIGIAEEDQSRIFERFQQVDGSNARKQEGTGLGLAITRHLVQMHGGTIKVQSELGKGSTFTVRLPAEHDGAGNVARAMPVMKAAVAWGKATATPAKKAVTAQDAAEATPAQEMAEGMPVAEAVVAQEVAKAMSAGQSGRLSSVIDLLLEEETALTEQPA